MSGYCEPADLYTLGGLPRGALANPARLVTADASSNAFTLDVHGFELDHPVTFRAESGGALPGGISAATTYYAIPVTEYSFKVAASAGGAAVDLTTAGSLVVVHAELPIDGAITFGARIIDQALMAHPVPLEAPYPEIIVITNAELAVARLMSGSESKSLGAISAEATKRVQMWAKGVPVRAGDDTPAGANKAVAASVPYCDARGWNRHGGL